MSHKEIEILTEIARKRGGKLITTEYKNNRTKMAFQCFHGHIFDIIPNSVKNGRWCPKCKAYNRTEEVCRVYFEHIFKSKFLKKRPVWLVGNNGYRIELDGYSKNSMVAFEYNGQQHYKKTCWYRFDDAELKRIQENEVIKISKCKEYGVFLIVISYKTRVSNFLLEIRRQLINLDYPDIDSLDWTEPSLVDVYTNEIHLKKLRDDLLTKGFNLLDSEYRGQTYKYRAKCNVCGYVRCAEPWSLRKNSCKRCSGTEKKTINDAKKLAKFRGGECLSDVYINNHNLLEWKCSCGNVWLASFNCIQRGFWCPKDGREQKKLSVKASWVDRKKTENIIKFEKIKEFAKENGLELISKNYVSCDAPLIFLCDKGHEWKVGIRYLKKAIKQGKSCVKCKSNRIKTTAKKNVKS